jgi:hypothetical protein
MTWLQLIVLCGSLFVAIIWASMVVGDALNRASFKVSQSVDILTEKVETLEITIGLKSTKERVP